MSGEYKACIRATWDQLTEVLMYKPNLATYLSQFSWYESNFNGPFRFRRGVNGQHKNLEDLLRQEGVVIHDLKEQVLKNQRARELAKEIILESFRRVYDKMPQYSGRTPEKDAETLAYGAEDDMIWYTLTMLPRGGFSYKKHGKDPRNWIPRIICEPVGNLYFMRDQQAVTDKGLVMGKMKRPVRKREPSITELAWESLGVKPILRVDDGLFEGGDFMPCGDFAIIGIGNRTNEKGAFEIMNKKALDFDEIVLVYQPNDQERMHFDTWCSIINPSTYLVDPHSLRESRAKVYAKNDNGVYEPLYRRDKINLGDYLKKRGFDRIEISREEQLWDATNVEVINKNKIIAPDVKDLVSMSDRTNYIKTLRSYGIEVMTIPSEIIFLGGGGPHCSLTEVSRKW